MGRGGLVGCVFLLVVAGCGDDDGAPLPPYERACTDALACPGGRCIELEPNLQEQPGICSRPCAGDLECGAGAACFDLGAAGASCLSLCTVEEGCAGGFVCVEVGAAGERACFVEPGLP